MNKLNTIALSSTVALATAFGCSQEAEPTTETVQSQAQQVNVYKQPVNRGTQSLHLERRVRFNPIQPGADAVAGRALFGLDATDDNLEDPSGALFEGMSVAAGRQITSNGRTCFSCHRGADTNFSLAGELPLSGWIPATDTLFTGFDADAQGDPRAFDILDNLGLIKYRPNRFNLQRPQSDAFRKIFFWRKSQTLVNIAFNNGFLNDGRGRVLFEADRGAIFSHTQSSDDRFDDLFTLKQAADMEAFQFGIVSDPVLLALRDPAHPMHQTLVDDPFYTVPMTTKAQRKGAKVFKKQCMSCHNTPNVFNNLDNVEALGPDNTMRSVDFPAFGPPPGRNFNIGVAEANKHGLSFEEPAPGVVSKPS